MRLHRNAKTTPMTRQLMVHRLTHEGWTGACNASRRPPAVACANIIPDWFEELKAKVPAGGAK